MRKVLAIFVGLISTIIVLVGLEYVSQQVYPPPASLQEMDTEALNKYMMEIPSGAMVLVLISHFTSLFIGNLLALKISQGYRMSAHMVSGVFVVMVGLNLWMLDHPLWFTIADVIVTATAIWLPLRLWPENKK